MNELLNQIQQKQREILDLMDVTDGHAAREALNLAYQSLRLSWYMLRGDNIGIAEKTQFVNLAHESLSESLTNMPD